MCTRNTFGWNRAYYLQLELCTRCIPWTRPLANKLLNLFGKQKNFYLLFDECERASKWIFTRIAWFPCDFMKIGLPKKREEKNANHSNPNGNTPPEKRASKKVVDFYRCRWFGSDLPKNTKWRHSCYSNCIICCSHCRNKSNKNHSEENLLTCHGFGEKNELAPKYGDTLKPLRWLVRVFSRFWRLCLSVSHLIVSFAGVSSRTSNDDNELRL